MNGEKLTQLIQGIGVLTELWVITFQSFKSQGMDDVSATRHTKAFMSIILDPIFNEVKEASNGN